LCIFLYLFIAVRSAYPRFRFDQLMKLGWKVFLPLALGFVWIYAGLIIGLEGYSTINTDVFYCI